jgi:predicted AAA+ superfamily ATPase
VDEVQRVPELLPEVHALMSEWPGCRFVLTGSSARKLRRSGTDLLAGRAVQRYLFPLTVDELGEAFDLEHALSFGTLPSLAGRAADDARDALSAYVDTSAGSRGSWT